MDDDVIAYLLKYCAQPGMPELYNKISNLLYNKLKMHSAEASLICTWCVNEYNYIEWVKRIDDRDASEREIKFYQRMVENMMKGDKSK